MELPVIPEQLRNEPRKSLDLTILEALDIKKPKVIVRQHLLCTRDRVRFINLIIV